MTSLLPFPELQFFSDSGATLALGTVETYTPGTLDQKTTWQDANQVTANTNPIVLDAAGRCIVFGAGDYRFVVRDALGNLIYDQLTSSTLAESVISAAMLPVVGSASLSTARDLMGITAAISAAVSGVSLITGPTGGQGVTGPTGPTGASGSAGSVSVNRQVFTGSGTWTKPATGGIAIIQLWGAGGGASDSATGGGGGGGGYTCVACLLSDLASTVAVTIGAGGLFNSGSLTGSNGGTTTFGSYLTQIGGNGSIPDYDGAQGYLSAASGLSIIFGTTQQVAPIWQNLQSESDQFGNRANTSPFAGTTGFSSNGGGSLTPWPSVFGGTGGATYGSNGASPGGGGAVNGGNGGNGQIIVTVI